MSHDGGSSEYLLVARLDDLSEDVPAHGSADGIDLVVVRRGGTAHVFDGRCPHRGVLLADGRVEGANLICGVHGWDYRHDSLSHFTPHDLTRWKREVAELLGVSCAGVAR